MLIDAPWSINIAMASVEFLTAAQCTGVLPKRSRLFTSAPFCRSNRMTSVLFNAAAPKSAVWSSQSTQSTGTPSCNMLSLRLTTPLLAARWNRSTRSLSIYMEETVKSKQFDVCQTLWHSVQSSTFVQTLVEVKKILFRMEINLSAINNLQYFWKIGICNN